MGSHWAKELLPSEVAIAKADAGASGAPKGKAHSVINRDTPLSPSQSDMMLQKAIRIFEGATNHIERDELKMKHRPSEDRVVQGCKGVSAQA